MLVYQRVQRITMFTHSMWEFLLMLTSTKSCRIHIPRTVILPESRTKSSWRKWSHLDLRSPDLNFLRRTSQLLFSADHTCTKVAKLHQKRTRPPRPQDPEASWATNIPGDWNSEWLGRHPRTFPLSNQSTRVWTLPWRADWNSQPRLESCKRANQKARIDRIWSQRITSKKWFQSGTLSNWYTFSSLKMIELFPPNYPLVN